MPGRGVVINTGNVARLRKYVIIGNIPLCDKFPMLYEICVDQDWILDQYIPLIMSPHIEEDYFLL